MAEEESQPPIGTTSLFAAFAPPQVLPARRNTTISTTSPAAAALWLQNPSFTTDLSVINDAASKYDLNLEEEENQQEDDVNSSNRRPQYEMVPSSPSDRSDGEEDRKNRKKKKKRRNTGVLSGETRPSYDYVSTISSSYRKPGVQKWAASSTTTSGGKEYYFDSRGDRDNLAFGCTYRYSQ